MLWRRITNQHNHTTRFAEFTTLGALTARAAIVGAAAALWASLNVLGAQ